MGHILVDNGNRIELDAVDAVGELPDGRFEIWLNNDRRLISSEAGVASEWLAYLRSKVTVEVTPIPDPDNKSEHLC